MQLIDTHVHLNFDVLQADLPAISERWRSVGVVHLVHSCVQPEEFAAIKAIADQFGEISFAVGLHPLDAQKWRDNSADQIESLARSDRRVVAIGEMGLDFYKADNQEQQKQVFWRQLEIAHRLDKPVIIHCRDAAPTMREEISAFRQQVGKIGGVMHCWTGNPEETQWFLDLGFYISFSGIVTFKNSKTVQAAAQIVPSDRILIETDCPFLSPNPHRGKPCEPSFVFHVAETVARLRGVSLETLAEQTTQNARNLFQLPS
ncbi:MAG: TatD family hydrolase [Microcystis aeruginosa K13-07]|jgi:TatD DNase family protein|nr:TatD family hydrolase [Microcystis aeruginosa K13-07]